MSTFDRRGMPAHHTRANTINDAEDYRQAPALAKYAEAYYTGLPLMPAEVAAAREQMDKAAELVGQLDAAAGQLLREYRDAPGVATQQAEAAVVAGKVPDSSTVLSARLDELAVHYIDAVRHRRAVEAHLSTLVDRFHDVATAHLPAWRDAIAAELAAKADPVRVALARALADARDVVALAFAVEGMDRPHTTRGDRPKPSALYGKELPQAFALDYPPGVGRLPSTAAIESALDDAGKLASVWLRVEGTTPLGQGPMPEALTVPVADLPERDMEAERARAEHKRQQMERAREIGMSDQRAHDFFGF